MFEQDQRAPLGACEREVARSNQGGMPKFDEVVLYFDRAFKLEEVADKLGISPRQARALTDDGSLVKVNVGRGTERGDWRVLDEDLDAFIRHRKAGLVAPTIATSIDLEGGGRGAALDSYEARRAARIAKAASRGPMQPRAASASNAKVSASPAAKRGSGTTGRPGSAKRD